MSKTYTDYENKIALTVPDVYIDTKTGNSHAISSKVEEQIEYHAQNGSLHHLIFSALQEYFIGKKAANSSNHTAIVLQELADIKSMLEDGYFLQAQQRIPYNRKRKQSSAVTMEEVQDILDSFGG